MRCAGAPPRIPQSNRETRGGFFRKGMGMGKVKRISSQGRNLLSGARAYLSGPMDFVASRAFEKEHGWRNRVGQFLQTLCVTVFDPWNKPPVKGFDMYGEEDVKSVETRAKWTFEEGRRGALTRIPVCGRLLGNTARRSPYGRHERFRRCLLPDEYLQCGDTSRGYRRTPTASQSYS